MSGTVVTFYSYKGGVGRSFTLANIAVLLARWGYRVLTIDWDLEAPGLHQYFAPLMANEPAGGLVDLVDDFTAGVVRPAATHVTALEADGPGTLALLAAGRRDGDYAGRVQDIHWPGLYQLGFAGFLETCRQEWTAAYDFVLVDSRTGLADVAGICTAQLPDRLVVVFTANDQSMGGAVDVAARADVARDRLPYDRPKLTVLPILSRLDGRVEYERAEQWHRKCAELTRSLFANWLVRTVDVEQLLRHLTLPYVSYWSFGEQLPVREERAASAGQLSYALETVAAIIAHQFDRTDLLADNRDAYVTSARRPKGAFDLDILVSSPRSAEHVASAMVAELTTLGAKASRSLSGDPNLLAESSDRARHLCLIVDGQLSRWQNSEAEHFLRYAMAGEDDRRLVPVLTRMADPGSLPGFLRNLRRLHLGGAGSLPEVARRLHGELAANGSGSSPQLDDQAYPDAVDLLRRVLGYQLPKLRWELVDQVVLSMADAVGNANLVSVRDLTLDLELATRTPRQATADRQGIPEDVRGRVTDLIRVLVPRVP